MHQRLRSSARGGLGLTAPSAALEAAAWALRPEPTDEGRHLLRHDAAVEVDRLLARVARSRGALDVAVSEGLAALAEGDRLLRLGWSNPGDYAREVLGVAGRTAQGMVRLGRGLRERPLLRAAVRRGLVTVRAAQAVLPVAKGDAEAEWVELACRETVRGLTAAVRRRLEVGRGGGAVAVGALSGEEPGELAGATGRVEVRAGGVSALPGAELAEARGAVEVQVGGGAALRGDALSGARGTVEVQMGGGAELSGHEPGLAGAASASGDGPFEAGGPGAAPGEEGRLEGSPSGGEAGDDGAEPDDGEAWQRVAFPASPSARAKLKEALEVAGRMLGDGAPRWQRLEGLAQEYLGAHPEAHATDEVVEAKLAAWRGESAGDGRAEAARAAGALSPHVGPATAPWRAELEAYLEVETKRWEWLDTVEGVAAPEVAEEGASPAQLDASLRALLALRTRWDALLGHLGLLVRRYWLWREAGFASFGHYCRDRLGLGLRSVEQRIALERRLYGLPPALRAALAEGRLSLERARLVARVATEFTFEAWMTHARGRTCLALRREVMALEEAGAFASLPPGVAGDGPLSTRPEGGVGHRAAAVTGLAASVECVEADSQVRAAGDGGAGAAPLAPPQPPTAQVCAPGAADGSPPATAQLCAPGVATDATPAPSPRCTRCDEAMPAGARKALPGTAQVCAPCAREVAEAAASRRWTVHDNPPEPSLTQQPLPPWQAPPPPPRVRLLEVEGAAPQQWTAQLWEPPTRDGKRELRLRVPVPVASLLAAAFEAVRQAEGRRLSDSDCLERVAAHFLEAWGALPPVKRTPQRRALLRDGHRCQVPGCSRAAVHAHHIVYRAHGGSDGPDNLVSLCAAHHLHGVHRGWVRVRGVAPDGLTWELGERG